MTTSKAPFPPPMLFSFSARARSEIQSHFNTEFFLTHQVGLISAAARSICCSWRFPRRPVRSCATRLCGLPTATVCFSRSLQYQHRQRKQCTRVFHFRWSHSSQFLHAPRRYKSNCLAKMRHGRLSLRRTTASRAMLIQTHQFTDICERTWRDLVQILQATSSSLPRRKENRT